MKIKFQEAAVRTCSTNQGFFQSIVNEKKQIKIQEKS